MQNEEYMSCPRCKSRHVENHQEPGDLPWWECLDCGLCWDGTEGKENADKEHKRQVIRSLCDGHCSPDADCFKCLDNWLKKHGQEDGA